MLKLEENIPSNFTLCAKDLQAEVQILLEVEKEIIDRDFEEIKPYICAVKIDEYTKIMRKFEQKSKQHEKNIEKVRKTLINFVNLSM